MTSVRGTPDIWPINYDVNQTVPNHDVNQTVPNHDVNQNRFKSGCKPYKSSRQFMTNGVNKFYHIFIDQY